jgi:hypothetical protein
MAGRMAEQDHPRGTCHAQRSPDSAVLGKLAYLMRAPSRWFGQN